MIHSATCHPPTQNLQTAGLWRKPVKVGGGICELPTSGWRGSLGQQHLQPEEWRSGISKIVPLLLLVLVWVSPFISKLKRKIGYVPCILAAFVAVKVQEVQGAQGSEVRGQEPVLSARGSECTLFLRYQSILVQSCVLICSPCICQACRVYNQVYSSLVFLGVAQIWKHQERRTQEANIKQSHRQHLSVGIVYSETSGGRNKLRSGYSEDT